MTRSLTRTPGRSLRTLAPRPVAAVVLLLITVLVASGCKFDGAYDLPLPGNKVSSGDGYTVTADFADALNVVPRTAVYANDVVVGQVTDVSRAGWHARVKFLVRKDINLPENVEVDVRQTSLLGEKYIALVAPPKGTASTKLLSAGDFIPLSRTSRNPEVEEVLGALSMVLSGGGIGQLKTISHELNNMMNGRQDQARHVLGNLDRMIGGLDAQKTDIIAAMDSIDRLSSTLVKEKGVIGEAIDSMGPALKVLNNQHQALMTMLRQLDSLGVVGTRVIRASRENIVASLRHLQPTLTKLGDAGDALAPGLSMLASFPFPKEAGNIVRGDYANALFHLDIDLGKVIKSPSTQLPNLINLCSTLPLAPACDALTPALKATICAVADVSVVQLLCPPGSSASEQTQPSLPDLGLPKGGSGSTGSGGSGGLGGLLGLGGGG